ncbi:MAG: hypothetical protein BWX67_01748 [Thermotogae bacterium ADurb.Bin062]|nr:MAG: hypothetical protein BWX67_01748 [Thermotogota bacterium ADurb.Bin062]
MCWKPSWIALGTPTLKLACLKSESQERAERWTSLVSRDFVGFRSQPAGYLAKCFVVIAA